MHGPDGGRYPNSSLFRTLDAPRTIVIEHISPPHFVLTVTLEGEASGTRLTWAQGFPDADVAALLQKLVVPANEENLDRLAAVLGEKKGG